MDCRQLLYKKIYEKASSLLWLTMKRTHPSERRSWLFITFLLLVFPRFTLASNTLEAMAENSGQCLQAGLTNKEPNADKHRKYFGGWIRFKKGALVILGDCNQSNQQDWLAGDSKVSGLSGDLAVIRLGRKFVPVVSQTGLGKHLRPVRYEQGRLVFDYRSKPYCLTGHGGIRFSASPLEKCLEGNNSTTSRWLYGLPPEPGEAGLVGLEGVDSDQDGVRDDIQRFIEIELNDYELVRKAARQLAVAKQKELTNAYNREVILQLEPESSAAGDCLFSVSNGNSRKYLTQLKALTYNTEERLKAWNKINSYFSGMTFTLPDDLRSQCNFDTNLTNN